jgi:hypothetical protein
MFQYEIKEARNHKSKVSNLEEKIRHLKEG